MRGSAALPPRREVLFDTLCLPLRCRSGPPFERSVTHRVVVSESAIGGARGGLCLWK
jgi:hypothetical protein